MALKIRTIGNPDLIGDIQPGWSIDENATPHAIGDGSASVGGVQFSAGRRDDSEFLLNKPVTVYYEPEGTVAAGNNVTGVFDSVDTSGGSAGVSSTNLLSNLTVERSVRPSFPLTNKIRTITGTNTGGNSADLGYFPRTDPVKGMVATIDVDYTLPSGALAAIKYYDYSGNFVSKTVLSGGTVAYPSSFPYEIDDQGRFYLSDQPNKKISVYSNSGAFITSWASPSTDDQGFTTIKYNPYDNNIWVVDNVSRIRVFNKSGGLIRTWNTYDNLFTPAQGIGVRASSVAFTPTAVHVAQVDGIYAYTTTGSSLFSTPYEDISYANGNARKFLEIDRFGNYVLAIIGRLYVYGQRGRVLYKTETLSGLPSGVNSSARGLCITPDGHYMVGVEVVNSVASFQVFAGAPTTLRGYFSAVINQVLGVAGMQYLGSNPSIIYPGWNDSLWTKLNELCAAAGKEIVLQNDTIIVRDVASATISLDNFVGSPQRSVEKGSGRHIEIVNQNTSVVSNGPVFDYTVDAGRAISADLNEYNVTNVRLNTWLTSIQSPTPIDAVIGVYTPPGTYMVFSQENFPVPANTWKQYGGSFTATVGADGQSIDFAMQGPSVPIGGYTAPFSISAVLGGSKVTGVSVLGSGVMTNPIPVTVATGADWSIVTQDIAQTINQPFITSLGVLFDRAEFACAASNGGGQVLDITVPTSDIGGLGLTAGSMFQYGKTVWRVRSSKIGNATVSIKADSLTSVGQHDSVVPGETIGQHDARLAALTLGDSALKPLY